MTSWSMLYVIFVKNKLTKSHILIWINIHLCFNCDGSTSIEVNLRVSNYKFNWLNYFLDSQPEAGLAHLCLQMSKRHDDVIKFKQFPRYWPFVRGIHRGHVNSPHNWPVTRKMSPFDDVIMQISIWSMVWCIRIHYYLITKLLVVITYPWLSFNGRIAKLSPRK